MTAPVLAVGDGALGFWKAVREVFPATKEQRCWFHKQANVLAALPKSAHPSALAAIKDIYNAEDIDKAQVAVKAFEVDFGAKYPKAVAKIVDDRDTLLEFYKYPAEHWIHLRTTNPIESTFATVRLRTKVTKGPGSRAAGHGLDDRRVGMFGEGRLDLGIEGFESIIEGEDGVGQLGEDTGGELLAGQRDGLCLGRGGGPGGHLG